MHSIWYIPELLIHILLNLDAEDLPRCYHVSHYWRATLKNNLPPHRRALPDSSGPYSSARKTLANTLLPKDIRELAATIKSHEQQWCNLANFMDLGDDHFYWREGACMNLLEHLSPQLHPWISSHACVFIEGLDALINGEMNICIRTECTIKEFIQLCEEEHDQQWRNGFVTYPLTRSLKLYCPKGAEWDMSNKSVIQRDGFTWRASSIRLERENGVRMGDVVDELSGVLVPDQQGALNATVMLEWIFKKGPTVGPR